MDFLKWLYPGMHVKRWFLLLLVGITFFSLGIGYFLVQLYREQPFPEAVAIVTLQFIPRVARGIIFVGAGGVLAALAVIQLNRSLISAVIPGGQDNILNLVFQRRYLQRGPKVVAIGGGTGLSTLLRGLKSWTSNIAAVVTVADDGGSSGRLRRELGVLPPGDFRQCLVALADAEPLMTKLFQYRFGEGTGLEGHSFGNLFIVAMTAITGNFERALRESSRVLAVHGQILPSTLANLTLVAEFEDQDRVSGESQISKTHKAIKRVFLQPARPTAYPEAVRSILEADLVVIGPGSLYTSVMPNLLVEDIARALKASSAVKVYVCNVATQEGETDNLDASDHVLALTNHTGSNIIDYVLVNNNLGVPLPHHAKVSAVSAHGNLNAQRGQRIVLADVIDPANPLRHDPKKLTQALMRIYYERAQVKEESAAEADEASRKAMVQN